MRKTRVQLTLLGASSRNSVIKDLSTVIDLSEILASIPVKERTTIMQIVRELVKKETSTSLWKQLLVAPYGIDKYSSLL